MFEIKIDKNWTFKECVENIEAVKSQFEEIIASFSCLQQHEQTLFMREFKRQIYELKFSAKRHDSILEYIYGDIEYQKLLDMLGGNKNGQGTKK